MSLQIQNILLTTDLSKDAMRAFTPVTDLARSSGASVTLLHVVHDLVVAPRGAPLAALMHSPDVENQVVKARKKIVEEASSLEGLEVKTEVLVAPDVAKAIAEAAHQGDFDLIALSTHGRTGFRRMVLGSVAEAVLRHSDVPVLCFPRHSK